MVVMFVGGVVLLFDGLLVLFLPWEIYGAGVFCSHPNRYVVKLLMNKHDLIEHPELFVFCTLTNEHPAFMQVLVLPPPPLPTNYL